MTTVMRERTESEIERLYGVLEQYEPSSNEYRMVADRIKTLTDLVNADDQRIDNAIAAENKHKLDLKAVGNTLKLGLVGAGVTLLSWVGTWYFNDRAQKEAHAFESDYAYTSKARQWCTKEPNRR